MTMVRLYLAGAAFIFLARHYRLSNASILVGAIVVISSGFAAYAVIEEPFFLNVLVILPFFIIGLNEIFESGRTTLFTVMVFVTLVSNFYLAYIVILGIICYAVILYLIRYRGQNLFQLLKKCLLSGIKGVLLASVIIVPVIYALQGSPRVGQKLANGLWLYPLRQYLSLPAAFVSGGSLDTFWVVLPAIPLAAIAIIWSLAHWKERKFAVANTIYIIAFIGLQLPWFAAIFNGFSSPSNRWLFLLLPLIGINVASLLDEMITDKKRIFLNTFIGVALLGLITVITLSVVGIEPGITFSLIFLLIYMLLLVVSTSGTWVVNKRIWMAIVLCNGIFGLWSVQILAGKDLQNRLPASSKLINSVVNNPFNGAQKYATDNNRRAIIANYRSADGLQPKNFFGVQQGVVSFFSSMQQKSVFNFASDMGDTVTTPNFQDFYTDQKSELLNYLNVSHIFANGTPGEKVAAGYSKVGESNVGPNRNTVVYATTSNLPKAFFQSKVISAKTYSKLSPTQRESGLSRQASLQDTTGLRVSRPKTETKKISFDLVDQNGTVVSPRNFEIADSRSRYYLRLHKINLHAKRYELRVEFSGIHYQPLSLTNRLNATVWDDQRLFNNHIGFTNSSMAFNSLTQLQHLIQTGWGSSGWSIKADTQNGQTVSLIQPGQDDLSYFHTVKNATMNLGTFSDSVSRINLNFGNNYGIWRLHLRVVALPIQTSSYLKSVKVDRHSGVTDFIEKNNGFGFNLHNHKAGVVQTTIPDVKGWHATMDGHSVPIEKVNNAFLGVKVLHSGTHKISFKYRTPGLILGLLISIGTFLSLLSFRVVKDRRLRQKGELK